MSSSRSTRASPSPVPPRSERADDHPARLGHRFRDAALLRAALTHSSAGEVNNERLEFLGDAVLTLLVAETLYARFPGANEGQLSRLRASLVKRETLARLARGLMLGPQLILGEGEKRSGGAERDSNLANALEAVIGAIYLDGGIDACRTEVLPWFAGTLDGPRPRWSSQGSEDRAPGAPPIPPPAGPDLRRYRHRGSAAPSGVYGHVAPARRWGHP